MGDTMKIISFSILCLIAFIAAVGVACAIGSPISSNEAQSTKLKPDIDIVNAIVTRVDGTSESDNIRIAVTITNTAKGTSTGPFNVRVGWREIPRSVPQWITDPEVLEELAAIPWNYLSSARVENLINNPSKKSFPTTTLYFYQTVPLEELEENRYVYNITADYLNQVDEAKEVNNVQSASYPRWYAVVP